MLHMLLHMRTCACSACALRIHGAAICLGLHMRMRAGMRGAVHFVL